MLALGACNPVETFRDWTGASQNDPDPETTPNTRNLAAGEASDYPNLATVPPPPIRGLTAADREKLTQSLIADRTNAKHTDEQLRAGFPTISATPPPPPSATESGGPSASPSAEPGGAPSTSSPNTATSSGKAAGPGQGLRKQGEPPEPGPMESSLAVPQARATPAPEQIQPAPAPPQLPPTPRAVGTPTALTTAPAQGAPTARAPLPEETGSAAFQPPPPTPELPPLAPTRSAAAGSGKATKTSPPPAEGAPIAEIKFAADPPSLTDDDRRILASIVPLYQQNPGRIRIVGYAGTGAGSGAVEQLNSFRAALDRAQIVAAALTQAGIPADKIQVEAAPAGANSGESRADIVLEH